MMLIKLIQNKLEKDVDRYELMLLLLLYWLNLLQLNQHHDQISIQKKFSFLFFIYENDKLTSVVAFSYI
jgi:hypothetical protein